VKGEIVAMVELARQANGENTKGKELLGTGVQPKDAYRGGPRDKIPGIKTDFHTNQKRTCVEKGRYPQEKLVNGIVRKGRIRRERAGDQHRGGFWKANVWRRIREKKVKMGGDILVN